MAFAPLLLLTLTASRCAGPEDIANTVRRELPAPAKVCEEAVNIRYPQAGQSWRRAALNALEDAEALQGHRKACLNWYKALRARYLKGGA